MNGERVLSMEEIAAMGEAIAETAAIIDVATHRFLTQLREFDRVDGWHRAGALSCAHWLSWRVGMDLGAAREGDSLVFRDPGGQVVSAQGLRWEVVVDAAAVAGTWSGRAVTAEAHAPGWAGERVDYDRCVDALG